MDIVLVILKAVVIGYAFFFAAVVIQDVGRRILSQPGDGMRLGIVESLIDVPLFIAWVAIGTYANVNPFAIVGVAVVAGYLLHRLIRGPKKPVTVTNIIAETAYTIFCIAIAFALAFAITNTIVRATKISISAMGPSVLGDHFAAACPHCGHEFAIPSFGLPVTPSVECPSCQQTAVCETKPTIGDRILIDLLSKPQRWQLAIFNNPYLETEEPNEPRKPVLTRVVGMPGETIELLAGDVFVNGLRLVKWADEFQYLWFPHSDFSWGKPITGKSPWEQTSDGDGIKLRWSPLISVGMYKDVDTATIRIITKPRPVRDARLEVWVSDQGTGPVALTWKYAEMQAVVTGHRNKKGITIEAAGKVVEAPEAMFTESIGIAFRDGVVTALADSKPVVTMELESFKIVDAKQTSPTENARCDLSIQCARQPLRATIHRDVHYLTEGSPEQPMRRAGPGDPYTVPANGYFVLGDDSGISEDSRVYGILDPKYTSICTPGSLPMELLQGVVRWRYHPFGRSQTLP